MSDGSLIFYKFPDKVTGEAEIPILGTPTPLAAITIRTRVNAAISLRATVGWAAQYTGLTTTNVIFKIWRGAPVTGALVVSVQDSCESKYDSNKVTALAGVDFGFTRPQTVRYVLTAELPDTETAAQVSGDLTFTTVQNDMTRFFFITLPNNTVGSAAIPVSLIPAPLSSLLIKVNANDSVFLRATIGWTVQSPSANVLFRLWRGAPFTGKLVASALDSGEFKLDRNKVTSLDGVDTGLTSAQDVNYVLTAETTGQGRLAQVVGALTLTGARFPQLLQQTKQHVAKADDPVQALFYTLPDTTAGSVSIPQTTTPQPIAALDIGVTANSEVLLKGTARWESIGLIFPETDIVFKLWRGVPVVGKLVYIAKGVRGAESGNITSFTFIDKGFYALQDVTYVLTAESVNAAKSATIIGALTLTAIRTV